jgi:hypothetical protein
MVQCVLLEDVGHDEQIADRTRGPCLVERVLDADNANGGQDADNPENDEDLE